MGAVTIGPLERFGVGIVGTDVAHDLSFEIVSRPEDAASDQVTLDLREPDFDLVEPGRVGWCVVDSERLDARPETRGLAWSYERKGCPR